MISSRFCGRGDIFSSFCVSVFLCVSVSERGSQSLWFESCSFFVFFYLGCMYWKFKIQLTLCLLKQKSERLKHVQVFSILFHGGFLLRFAHSFYCSWMAVNSAAWRFNLRLKVNLRVFRCWLSNSDFCMLHVYWPLTCKSVVAMTVTYNAAGTPYRSGCRQKWMERIFGSLPRKMPQDIFGDSFFVVHLSGTLEERWIKCRNWCVTFF